MKNFKSALLIIILGLMPGMLSAKTFNALESKDVLWKNFRDKFNYHIQVIGVKKYDDKSVNIILSEPPNRVSEEAIKTRVNAIKGSMEIKVWKVGVDGWVKDVVISAENLDDFALNNFLAELNELVFYTTYKADYLDLNAPLDFPVHYSQSNLNYEVTANELNEWLLNGKMKFYENSKISVRKTIAEIMTGKKYGEYFSENKGFVLWVLPRRQDITRYAEVIRQFTLDSDLILGSFSDAASVAIVGRERNESVYTLPPLRVESVLLLGAANKEELAQSYERTNVFAGKLKSNKDWAPIYLSNELLNTEYGSLLNITDQMLKGWSQRGTVRYDNFNYPLPDSTKNPWVFAKPISQEIDGEQVTFNWNTRGVGYSIKSGPYRVYSINRTGSLPMTYIPEGADENLDISLFEDKEYDFFSSLNNPCLVRVVQYVALYQIFSANNITANASHINRVEKVEDVLTDLLTKVLKRIAKENIKTEAEARRILEERGKRFVAEMSPESFDSICEESFDEEERKMMKVLGLKCADMFKESIMDDLKKLDKEFMKLQMFLNVYQTVKGDEGLKKIAQLMNDRDAALKFLNNPSALSAFDPIFELLPLLQKNTQLLDLYITEVAGEKDLIANKYINAWKKVNNKFWLKTPATVVSGSMVGEKINATTTGGHNIGAKIDDYIADATLAKGKVKISKVGGKTTISLNPEDLKKVNAQVLNKIKRSEGKPALIEKYLKAAKAPVIKKVDKVFEFTDLKNRGYKPVKDIGWTYGDDVATAKPTLSDGGGNGVKPPNTNTTVTTPDDGLPNNNSGGTGAATDKAGANGTNVSTTGAPIAGDVSTTFNENTLVITKNTDNTFMVNGRKTTTVYNLKGMMEDHLKKNSNVKEAVIKFERMTTEEVEAVSQNIRIHRGGVVAGGRRPIPMTKHMGPQRVITAEKFDLGKRVFTQLEDGIELRLPFSENPKIGVIATFKGIFRNLQAKAKNVIDNVLLGKTPSKIDVIEQIKKDLIKAHISFDEVILSEHGVVIATIIQMKDKQKDERYCQTPRLPAGGRVSAKRREIHRRA